MTVKYLDSEIFYDDVGSGNTIVLLHGFTECSSIWDYFSKELSSCFRVVLIDLPGHGKSQAIAKKHDMVLMGDVVKFVLDYLRISEAVVIGHSMGGYVALSFAKSYPFMIRGLGLFHSTASADSEQARQNRDVAIKAVEKNHQGFLFNFIPELFAPENRQTYRTQINNLAEKASRMEKGSIVAALQGMKEREEMFSLLKESTFPVMFIAGKKDSRIPFDSLMEQVAMPKTAISLFLEGVGHMGYLEARQQTLGFVQFFASSCFGDN